MPAVTGSISIKSGRTHYTLYFPNHGWMAGDMVQYLDDVYAAEEPRIAILRLLGYTLEMRTDPPPRVTTHWIEIDLESRTLATNSELITKSVKGEPLAPEDPYPALTLDRIHRTLDELDFTVKLYS
jgi:hypothetical protein